VHTPAVHAPTRHRSPGQQASPSPPQITPKSVSPRSVRTVGMSTSLASAAVPPSIVIASGGGVGVSESEQATRSSEQRQAIDIE